MIRWASALGVILLFAAGCVKSEVTESDSAKVKQEFSSNSYEEAMKASGKEKELEDEKAKWAAYEAAGSGGGPQQGQ